MHVDQVAVLQGTQQHIQHLPQSLCRVRQLLLSRTPSRPWLWLLLVFLLSMLLLVLYTTVLTSSGVLSILLAAV